MFVILILMRFLSDASGDTERSLDKRPWLPKTALETGQHRLFTADNGGYKDEQYPISNDIFHISSHKKISNDGYHSGFKGEHSIVEKNNSLIGEN
ncbi:hypothetical protein [Schleiferilactobacillus shenzhenensis]|uniref:hypothetical protein n=1 Tax=Schleiferilactobacillus shenzhenensis TaxID=1231337 RepID=UPI00058FC50D|nr:hypothetical protein [Schleiferilactobacillus shenzhenensis]